MMENMQDVIVVVCVNVNNPFSSFMVCRGI